MTIIPEDIKTEEEAMHWLMRHGYSEDLAKEEASLIMEDEEGSENSFLVLLYCFLNPARFFKHSGRIHAETYTMWADL